MIACLKAPLKSARVAIGLPHTACCCIQSPYAKGHFELPHCIGCHSLIYTVFNGNASDNDLRQMVGCRGRQVALDIVRGILFMHSKSMIHLDLKSSNGMSQLLTLALHCKPWLPCQACCKNLWVVSRQIFWHENSTRSSCPIYIPYTNFRSNYTI